MNDFFCPLPWNHMMFRSNGQVQVCCETYKHKFNPGTTILETANNPIMKKLRLELLDPNTKPSMCKRCYTKEQVLSRSTRTSSLANFNHWTVERARQVTNDDGTVNDWHLEYLDIRWSNLCNYKCRFCGIESSNLWLNETKMAGLRSESYLKNYNSKTGIAEYNMDWKDLKTHLPYVRYVKLAGGEPTIMPGTYQLLEELIRIGNTNPVITLMTNATTIKYGKYNLLELLKHFSKSVRIELSMEGMGVRHEWARSGKKDWDIIEKNIQAFYNFTKETDNRKLNFHSGITWMNMYHLADFVLAYPNIKFVFNLVSEPSEMSMLHFDKIELQRCSDYYNELLQRQHSMLVENNLMEIKSAIDNCITKTTQDYNLEKFKYIQTMLDKNRNQSFVKAYPEWRHLYE